MEQKFSLKKIFGNSMWQITEKILTMLLSVVVTSVVARYLGTEQYGLVNYIISVVMLFTTFSTLGMEQITINDIIDGKESKEKILGTSFIIRLIGGIILIIISQITLYVLTQGDRLSQILGIIMGTCILFKAFEVVEYYLQSQMKLKVSSIIRFVTTITVAAAKLLVVYFDLGIVGFTCTYLIDAIVAGFLFFIWYKKRNKERWRFSKKYAKSLLSRCWYIAIAGLMTTIYMRIDQVMLGTMLASKAENGIYAAAVRIAEMWYFVPLAIISSFQPVIMSQKKEKNEVEYKKMMQRLYDFVAVIGIVCGIIISLFGWIAIYILYGSEYAGASSVLSISVWAGLFATLGSARSVWLVAENKQRYTLVYTAVGCIINVGLNAILIPKMGAYGAAIATLVAQLIANIFALIPFKETRESSIMMLKSIFYNKTCIDFVKYISNKKTK